MTGLALNIRQVMRNGWWIESLEGRNCFGSGWLRKRFQGPKGKIQRPGAGAVDLGDLYCGQMPEKQGAQHVRNEWLTGAYGGRG